MVSPWVSATSAIGIYAIDRIYHDNVVDNVDPKSDPVVTYTEYILILPPNEPMRDVGAERIRLKPLDLAAKHRSYLRRDQSEPENYIVRNAREVSHSDLTNASASFT
jgi:hypothetical protein